MNLELVESNLTLTSNPSNIYTLEPKISFTNKFDETKVATTRTYQLDFRYHFLQPKLYVNDLSTLGSHLWSKHHHHFSKIL